MKKHFFLPVLAIALFFFSSFENSDIRPLPTSLKVTVLDELGNPVPDAEVILFGNETDYKAETNPIAQQITNKKGVAVFKKLKIVRYFVLASLGDKNNIGSGVQTDTLKEGKINLVNTIIQ